MKQNKTETKIAKRLVAGFIDYFIIFSFFIFYVYSFGQPNADGGYSINELPALIPVIFWGIMTIGLESGFGGTLDNSLVGIKAIPMNKINRKLTFGESCKRHLLEPIDISFFGIIGIITIKNTINNQRLGDLWFF